MRKSFAFFLWFIVCFTLSIKGNSVDVSRTSIKDTQVFRKVKKQSSPSQIASSDSLKENQKDIVYHKKHRLVAALLALPLGVFGLHRIYMHTSPIVPFVYIVTFGGVFGILPFIDFVLILLNKDIHLTYTSNPHLFMWQKR